MRIHNSVRYVSFAASAAALWWLAEAGVIPIRNPLRPDQYIIDTSAHSPRTLRNFFSREDVILGLTWQFAVAGATLTLASDFNTASNQVNAIGSGTGGFAGSGPVVCGCGTAPGDGGNGGAGGAFARIINYAGHSAGQVVNIQVGAGDTFFDSNVILLAKAASGSTGGQAAASVGTTKASGGNGGTGGITTGGLTGGGGAGGGGAAGPGAGSGGAGNNGANGVVPTAGVGGSGDAGNTAAGANGAQFDATHGSGGGGGGGNGTTLNGAAGTNAGSYGGGGGGGGGSGVTGTGGAPGTGFQGLIAIGYTPAAGGAHSYGFLIG